MRCCTWILVASCLAADPALAQCSSFISAANSTGQDMGTLLVVFAGVAPSVSAEVQVVPDTDPVCPPPTIGGDLLSTIGIGWEIDCVDPGSTATFQTFSPEETPAVFGGRWSDLGGHEFPIPAEGFSSSPDCNGNCIADELDITAGTSADADQNGVPDECEAVTAIPVLGRGRLELHARQRRRGSIADAAQSCARLAATS